MTICDDLRQSVLQAAIQGKLTKQLPEDGTAADLLASIKAEKEKLIKEKKIKKEKPLAPISADEIPFDIPDNWEWVRLGDIGSWGSGATPAKGEPKFYNGGTIPWLVTGELTNGYVSTIKGRITNYALEHTSVKLNAIGSVLIAMYGATIGKLGILQIEATTNQACCACKPLSGVYNWFLFYFLMANKQNYLSQAEGGAQPNISKEKIVVSVMPLPPLAEQHRIVARVNELMAKIDELETVEKELVALKKAFPGDMKASLLQAAMQGKLTQQLPEDGSAADLMASIKAERKQLIKEKKIKKEKPLTPISADEIPFKIPENWRWMKFGLCVENHDAERKPVSKDKRISHKGTYLYYGATGAIDVVDDYIFDGEYLMIGEDGGNFFVDRDNSFIANGRFWANNHVHVVKPIILNIRYLKSFLDSLNLPAMGLISGIAVPKLNQEKLNSILVPIPPLAEQKRIVEKLDKLLPLCDVLKEGA